MVPANVPFYTAWAAVLLLALAVFVPQVHVFAVDRYEDITFAIDPTAARGFAYGERHFDATDPAEYDIARAQYFFQKVVTLDPKYPYLYHELARISFLKANFTAAMAQINFQISLHGDSEPKSYYVRGLIEGYMGDYADAATDYEHFLQIDPNDPNEWGGMNDYAWVLLKADRPQDAGVVTTEGLKLSPDNPWLLNSQATALYEMNAYSAAYVSAQKASAAVAILTESEWLHAYPGNDPKVAAEGIASFKQAVADNMHMIQLALASSTVQ